MVSQLRRSQLCCTGKAKAQLFCAGAYVIPFVDLPAACVGALESTGSFAFLSFPVNVRLSRGSIPVYGP